jgi:hypothetical protein
LVYAGLMKFSTVCTSTTDLLYIRVGWSVWVVINWDPKSSCIMLCCLISVYASLMDLSNVGVDLLCICVVALFGL